MGDSEAPAPARRRRQRRGDAAAADDEPSTQDVEVSAAARRNRLAPMGEDNNAAGDEAATTTRRRRRRPTAESSESADTAAADGGNEADARRGGSPARTRRQSHGESADQRVKARYTLNPETFATEILQGSGAATLEEVVTDGRAVDALLALTDLQLSHTEADDLVRLVSSRGSVRLRDIINAFAPERVPSPERRSLDHDRVDADGHDAVHDDDVMHEGRPAGISQIDGDMRALASPNLGTSGTDKMTSVHIYNSGEIAAHVSMLHPVVRVTFVGPNGKYVTKTDENRSVVTQYEAGCKLVLPVCTGPSDLLQSLTDQGLLAAEWDEELVFDETPRHLCADTNLLFFELLDFRTGVKPSVLQNKGGYYHAAWGYLKPSKIMEKDLCKNGPIQVQLYKYKKGLFWGRNSRALNLQGVPEAYRQYQRGKSKWVRYSTPITVAIRARDRIPRSFVETRPIFPGQVERGRRTIEEMRTDVMLLSRAIAEGKGSMGLDRTHVSERFAGATGRWCRVPNVAMHQLETDVRGCYCMAFSNDGAFLACCVGGKQMFTLSIFNVATGKLEHTLPGHHDMIYSVAWSKDDSMLVTSSSDCTAKLWRLFERPKERARAYEERMREMQVGGRTLTDEEIEALPPIELPRVVLLRHTSFVYTAAFRPDPPVVDADVDTAKASDVGAGVDTYKGGTRKEEELVVTGGYDSVLRVFRTYDGAIQAELRGHDARVNSVAFTKDGTSMFSADGEGTIKLWAVNRWECTRTITDHEIKGVAINHIQLPPDGRKLLVHARDNVIRVLETRTFRPVHKLAGLRCNKHQIRSEISPDGRFVLSGSEDGTAFVWSLDTGETLRSAWNVGFTGLMTGACWHPCERIVALCSFTRRAPVLLFKYEKSAEVTEGRNWEELAEQEAREMLDGKWRDLAGAFRDLDTDKDGQLSLLEFKVALVKLDLGLSDMQAEVLFRRADADNSGKVDFHEFVSKFAPEVLAQMEADDKAEAAAQAKKVDPTAAAGGQWGDIQSLMSALSSKTSALLMGLQPDGSSSAHPSAHGDRDRDGREEYRGGSHDRNRDTYRRDDSRGGRDEYHGGAGGVDGERGTRDRGHSRSTRDPF